MYLEIYKIFTETLWLCIVHVTIKESLMSLNLLKNSYFSQTNKEELYMIYSAKWIAEIIYSYFLSGKFNEAM